jgi:hypothetical protein
MALRKDGTVVAWGNNSSGATNVPVGLSSVRAIAAGLDFSVALKSNTTVVVWGASAVTSIPAGLSNVVRIAASKTHILALKADGTVVAWGGNADGQIFIPPGLKSVGSISAGGSVDFSNSAYRSYSLAIVNDLILPPLTISNGIVVIRFHAFAGSQYAVENSSNLLSGSWVGASPPITGDNSDVVVTNPVSSSGSRFFRVRQF